jgi:hypothetical protein
MTGSDLTASTGHVHDWPPWQRLDPNARVPRIHWFRQCRSCAATERTDQNPEVSRAIQER